MNKRIGISNTGNKPIYHLNFSSLEGEELMNNVLFACHDLKKITTKTIFMVDFTDTKLTRECFNYLVDCAKLIRPNVEKSAVCGINGALKYMFNIYVALTGSDVVPFNNRDEAIKYLLS